jgi:UDP-2,3-diacylglucosamine pyrophosphatase LpxH
MSTDSAETAREYVRFNTAIISDLHLTDAEPSQPRTKIRHPLWKKFKTRQFFIDSALVEFLREIEQRSGELPVELVLNGDIFDFDSVMAYPEKPIYRFHWIETRRGLLPKEERSLFKISVILQEHAEFVAALGDFIRKGNSVVIVPGNHDVELHFEKVQNRIIQALNLNSMEQKRVRFVHWFYISHGDTLIEHGNQQDPYCLCENPLNPFLLAYNELTIRLPFGNVAARYIMNGMGLFNPHVEGNYILSLAGYLKFFFQYLIRAQPLIIWTWLWGSVATMYHVTADRFSEVFKPKDGMESIVNRAAEAANASPRMVRELFDLIPPPATQDPLLIAKELWLDRLFLFTAGLMITFFIVLQLNQIFGISLFWIFVPIMLFMPFYIFYARSVISLVSAYKEPDENLFAKQSLITGVRRIVYGHTHIPRHEFYGAVEHLNSGSWSPGFTNVECTESVERNNYIWISESEESPGLRKAQLCQFSSSKKLATAQ